MAKDKNTNGKPNTGANKQGGKGGYHGKKHWNNKRGGNGKKPPYKGGNNSDDKYQKPDGKDSSRYPDGSNSPSWYQVASSQISADVTKIPFGYPVGYQLDGVAFDKFAIPSVMGVKFIPSIGMTSNATSPINLAANKIMTDVYLKATFDPKFAKSDAMMWVVAINNLLILYSHASRVYGFSTYYLSTNWEVPKRLWEAMGLVVLNSEDWAKYRANFNKLAYKMSMLYVPSQFSYFRESLALAANIYADSTSPNAGLIVMVPEKIYKWSASALQYGTKLVPVSCFGLSPSELLALLESLIDLMLNDVDSVYIMGMLRKVYGDEAALVMSTISEDFKLAPIMDKEFLGKLMNATINGIPDVSSGRCEIIQDANTNISVSYWTKPVDTNYSLGHLRKSKLLNIPSMDMGFGNESDQNMVLTSWMTYGNSVDASGSMQVQTFGSTIITTINIYSNDSWSNLVIGSNCVCDTEPFYLYKLAKASSFYCCPVLFPTYRTVATDTNNMTHPMGDIDKVAVIGKDQLDLIHSARSIALFTPPAPVNTSR